MKGQDFILLGGAAVLGYALFTKKTTASSGTIQLPTEATSALPAPPSSIASDGSIRAPLSTAIIATPSGGTQKAEVVQYSTKVSAKGKSAKITPIVETLDTGEHRLRATTSTYTKLSEGFYKKMKSSGLI